MPVTRVTRAAYARHRKVTAQYISRLVSEGKIKVDKQGKIDQARADADLGRLRRKPKVIAAKAQRQTATGSLTEARARKANADARIAELDLQERSRSLLKREEVLEGHTRIFANVRTRFRRLPRSLAPTLALMTAPAEIEAALLDAVEQVLAEVATAPLVLASVEPQAGVA